MGIDDPLSLSLGEWTACVSGWNRAHAAEAAPQPPTRAEFEAGILAWRGVGNG